jgi:hypothetical protein
MLFGSMLPCVPAPAPEDPAPAALPEAPLLLDPVVSRP